MTLGWRREEGGPSVYCRGCDDYLGVYNDRIRGHDAEECVVILRDRVARLEKAVHSNGDGE